MFGIDIESLVRSALKLAIEDESSRLLDEAIRMTPDHLRFDVDDTNVVEGSIATVIDDPSRLLT